MKSLSKARRRVFLVGQLRLQTKHKAALDIFEREGLQQFQFRRASKTALAKALDGSFSRLKPSVHPTANENNHKKNQNVLLWFCDTIF